MQTSLKSSEESLHRAQMVAISTRASYWEHFTGLPSWYLRTSTEHHVSMYFQDLPVMEKLYSHFTLGCIGRACDGEL